LKINSTKVKNKSAILLGILGDSLPKEVYSYLRPEEIEKLLRGLDSAESVSVEEETKVLSLFGNYFKERSPSRKNENTDFAREVLAEIEKIVRDSKKEESAIDYLKTAKKEELSKLALGESSKIVALVMSYADPNESSLLFEEFSEDFREEILEAIQGLDFYSEADLDELERFLRFKKSLIQKGNSPGVKNRNGRKVADLLTRVSPNISGDLISKIREKNPEFAENITEHYFDMNDLLHIGRNSLTGFLEQFHPIVVACALKGVDNSLKDQIFSSIDNWFKKKVQREMDCIGPVSLAEIEEAQKGILGFLRSSVDSGKIKLWKSR